ncbi:10613_t:CDS:2 [Ambispora gerdemannii]|uniref:10613_t:CDS:1 n=1 Tax=Ambispora gerdemannii TaxID=144530 RepID=A0A9N9GZG6_9GLOM|nr:10613_t:CDS:2 [Ambispora gerdemannii]
MTESKHEFKSIHQFVLNKNSLGTKTIYSPLLIAPSNLFWQLIFTQRLNPQTSAANPAYCSLFLYAVADKLEIQNPSMTLLRRKNIKARLFIKNLRNEYLTSGEIEDKYSYDAPNWGWNNFFRFSKLPSTFIIGVEFNVGIHYEQCITAKVYQENAELKEAWINDLNNPNTSDVKFVVGNQQFYASSKILVTRSNYFGALLKNCWAEHKTTSSSLGEVEKSTIPNAKRAFRLSSILKKRDKKISKKREFEYEINVSETDPKLFLQVLKYLYVGDITIKNDTSSKDAIDLYEIADKYLLDELRSQAQGYIIYLLTVENAAEILFSSAHQWPELKEEVKKFVVKNFAEIAKSPGYQHIVANRDDYPSFLELNNEIFLDLHCRS